MEIKFRYIYKSSILTYKKYYTLKEIEMLWRKEDKKLFTADIVRRDIWTGFKDRKGREIYDNDLLVVYHYNYTKRKTEKHYVGKVLWYEGSWHIEYLYGITKDHYSLAHVASHDDFLSNVVKNGVVLKHRWFLPRKKVKKNEMSSRMSKNKSKTKKKKKH